jgi:hypothetical protein
VRSTGRFTGVEGWAVGAAGVDDAAAVRAVAGSACEDAAFEGSGFASGFDSGPAPIFRATPGVEEAGRSVGVVPGASDGFAPDAAVTGADPEGSTLRGSALRELSLAGSDLAESFLTESFLPGAEGLLGDFVT